MFKKITSVLFILCITMASVFAGGTYEENLKKGDEYAAKKQYIYAMGYYYDAMEAMPNGYASEAYNKFTNLKKLIDSGKPASKEYDDFTMEDGWVLLIQDFEKYFSETPIFTLNLSGLIGNADKKTKKYEFKYKLYSKFSEKFGILYTSVFEGLKKAKKSNWGNLKVWPKESVFKNAKSSASLVTLTSAYFSYSTTVWGMTFSDKGWRYPSIHVYRSNALSDGGYYYYEDSSDGEETTVDPNHFLGIPKAKTTKYVPAWYSSAKQDKNGWSFYNVSFNITDSEGKKMFTSKKGRLIAPIYNANSTELIDWINNKYLISDTVELITPETKALLDSKKYSITMETIELISPTFTYVPEKGGDFDLSKEVISKTSANLVKSYSPRAYGSNGYVYDPIRDINIKGNLLDIVKNDISVVLNSLKGDYNSAYSDLQKKVNANSKLLSKDQQDYANNVMTQATAALKGTDVMLAKNKIDELSFVSKTIDSLVAEITSGNKAIEAADKKVSDYKSVLSEQQEAESVAAISAYKEAITKFDLDGITAKKVVFEKSIETLDGYYESVKNGKAAYEETNKKLTSYKSVLSEAQTKKADEAADALVKSLDGLNLEDMKAKAAVLDNEVATLDGYYTSVTEGNENIKKATARIQELKSTLSDTQTKASENAVAALETSLKGLNLDDMKAKAATLDKEVATLDGYYTSVTEGNENIKKATARIQELKSTLSDTQTKASENAVAALETSLKGLNLDDMKAKAASLDKEVENVETLYKLVSSGNEFVKNANEKIEGLKEALSDAQRKDAETSVAALTASLKGINADDMTAKTTKAGEDLAKLDVYKSMVDAGKVFIESSNNEISTYNETLSDAQRQASVNAVASLEKVLKGTDEAAVEKAKEVVSNELNQLKVELEAVTSAKNAILSVTGKLETFAELLNDAQTAPCKSAIAAVEKVMVGTDLNAINSSIEKLNKASEEINKALKEKFVAYNKMSAEEFSKTMVKVEKTKLLAAPVEVTQEMWNRVMGSNDCEVKGDLLPVTNVSLYEVIVFLNKLSMEAGLTPVYSINKSTDPATWGEIPTEDSKVWNKITVNAKANGFKLLSTKDVLGMYKTLQKEVYFDEAIHEVGDYSCKTNYSVVDGRNVYDVEIFDLSGNAIEMCFDKSAAVLMGPKATVLKNFEKDSAIGFRIYRNEQ